MMFRSTMLQSGKQSGRYSWVLPICAAFGLALPLRLNAMTCHDNYAYLTVYNENGHEISLQNASAEIIGYDVTSGQGCGGPHMVNGPNWCVDSSGGCSDASRTSDNVVQVLYHSGRSKSSQIGSKFREFTDNNPNFGLGLSQDQTEGSYSPDEMNLLIQFSLSGINIGNGRMISVPTITLGQGSESSGIAAIFNIFKDATETVFDAYTDDLEESLMSFTELVGEAVSLEYENNWYASQSGSNVYMTTYRGNPGLVIEGTDQDNNSYPVIIQDGGGDYSFTV